MNVVSSGGGGPVGGSASMQGSSAAPVTSQMTTPQDNEGEKQQAFVNIGMALDLLEKSLMPFGSETDEGNSLLKAIDSLTKVFGKHRTDTKNLIPAELQQLVGSITAQSPEQAAMAGQAAPGGAPMRQAA